MRMNCAPLLADFFFTHVRMNFLEIMIRSGHRRLAKSFDLICAVDTLMI